MAENQSNSVYSAYKELERQNFPAPFSVGTFVALQDLQAALGLSKAKFIKAILVCQAGENYKVRLAKGPAAFRGRRFVINDEEWLFIAIDKVEEPEVSK